MDFRKYLQRREKGVKVARTRGVNYATLIDILVLTRCPVHRTRLQFRSRSNKQKNKFIKKQA